MTKFWRTLITTLLLSGALWGYNVFFAASFEPATLVQDDQGSDPTEWDYKFPYLQELFQPGDWELTQPKVLEIGDWKILVDDYQMLNDMTISVNRCTIICVNQDQSLTEMERTARALVARCSQGGILQFEKSLFQGGFTKNNKIIHGRLNGLVQVYSRGNLEGPEDDFQLQTRDVQISDSLISTPAVVEFRYGKTEGKGTNVSIQMIKQGLIGNTFANSSVKIDQPSQQFNIDNITIKSLERLYLTLPSSAAKGAASAKNKNDSLVNLDMDVPVEIRCRGEIQYNVHAKIATLSDNVSLLRLISNNDPDTLLCDTLTLRFQARTEKPSSPNASQNNSTPVLDGSDRAPSLPSPTNPENSANLANAANPANAAAPANSANPSSTASLENAADQSETPTNQSPANATASNTNDLDVQFASMEAEGRPVILKSPSQKFSLQCNKLAYDQNKGSLEMSSIEPGELHWGNHELHAKDMVYYQIPGNPMGNFQCNCGGWIKSIINQNGSFIRLFWTERMSTKASEEDPTEQRVSLGAQARLELQTADGKVSSLTSEQLFFWLTPQKDAPDFSAANGADTPLASSTQTPPNSAVPAPNPAIPEIETNKKVSLSLSRMLAQNNVTIEAPQMTAHLNKAQFWFIPTTDNLPTTAEDQGAGFLSGGMFSGVAQPAGSQTQTQNSANSLDSAKQKQAFDINSSLLLGNILVKESKMHLSELILEENVTIREKKPANSLTTAANAVASPISGGAPLSPSAPPTGNKGNSLSGLLLSGARVKLNNPLLPTACVTLIGNPAQLKTDSLGITSSGIIYDRAINRVLIQGAGRATLDNISLNPSNQSDSPFSFFNGADENDAGENGAGKAGNDPNGEGRTMQTGNPLDSPSLANSANSSEPPSQFDPIIINWEKEMIFNGECISLAGNVKVNATARKPRETGIVNTQKCTIVSNQLDILLNQRVDLFQPNQDEKVAAKELVLNNQFVIENDEFEGDVQVSHDKFSAAKMNYYLETRTFNALGSGTLSTWRKQGNGSFDLLSFDASRLRRSNANANRYANGNVNSYAASQTGIRPEYQPNYTLNKQLFAPQGRSYNVGYPSTSAGERSNADRAPSRRSEEREPDNPYAEYGVVKRLAPERSQFSGPLSGAENSGNSDVANNSNNTNETSSARDLSQGAPAAGSAVPGPVPGQRGNKSDLIFFSLDFLESMEGNLNRYSFNFSKRIKAICGPVENFGDTLSASRISALPPNAVVMSCDALSLDVKKSRNSAASQNLQNPSADGAQPQSEFGKSNANLVDLFASGNVNVETTLYNVNSSKLSYSGERNLMIIEGDGLANAEIRYQKVIGGVMQTASGSKIRYWPKTGRVQVEGVQDATFDSIMNLGQ